MIKPLFFALAALAAAPASAALVEDQLSSEFPDKLGGGGSVPGALTQTFTPSVSTIAGLDVLVFGSFAPGETETITLDLFDPSGDPLLGTLSQSLAAEDHNSIIGTEIQFRFSPVAITPGALHSFTVEPTEGFLSVATDSQGIYSGGKVTEGNIAQGSIDETDVVFRTLYEDTAVVPLPAAGWFLLGALGLLGWRARRGA